MTSKPASSSILAFLVAGAYFMEMLDGTVVVSALPQMADSFGVQPIDLNIGISAYLLTLAVLIPASGWVADKYGPRAVFGWAIVIFTLASILCGLSTSLPVFTAARILQGVGGALMVPVGRLIVLRNTAKQDLMRAIATITWPGLAAPVLGPPIGGFLATYATWHWIFFLNVPLGIVGFILTMKLIPAGKPDGAKPFDWTGFVLIGAACFGLMYGLDLISRQDGSMALAAIWLAASAMVTLAAVLHARRAAHPLVDPWALRIRSFSITIWGGSIFRVAIGAVPFLAPLMFQLAFGLDAYQAGLLVLWVFAGNIVMKPFTTPVLRRFTFRQVLLGNGLLNAVLISSYALLTPATPFPLICALLFASGLTRSMQFTALNTIAFAEVPEARMSGANTLFNVAQQMSMGLGVGVAAAALRLAELWFPGTNGSLPLVDFQIAFAVIGLIAFIAILDMIGLDARAGNELRVRRAGAK
ncbi:MFS transporter [Labrys neptuniae]|uniref:MFS transporter n=1 Tax=Labrys neptuniae TaxID=376174 RepID=A0ABV3PXI8_9HYPH|nr:MFS transporter [Labrys neptuniae]MDT3375723.1 MFS transporter [Labrys neptuniae]